MAPAGDVVADGTRSARPAQSHKLGPGTRVVRGAPQVVLVSEMTAVMLEGGGGWWEAAGQSTMVRREVPSLSPPPTAWEC